jgi:succinoglycan biosynthesis transport protein ExoP
MGQLLVVPNRVSAANARGDSTSFAQLARAVRRGWKWVVGATLLAFLASLLFVESVTPRYTGEAKLLLENRDSFYTRPNQDRSDPAVLIDEQAVASQVQVIMSRDLAREAIRRLNLVGNPEFDPLVDGIGPIRRLFTLLGVARNPLDRPPEDRVLEAYFDRLLVYPAGKSRILIVEFRSRDPVLAANAANTIAELYLTSQEAAKKDTALSASTWLGTNIDDLRTRLALAEAKVEEFRTRSGLLGGATSGPLGTQQLAEISTQLSQARSAQADAQAKAALIKDLIRSGRTFEIPDVANNELVRRLIEQRITLRAQLALEARTLLPQHPRIKELNAQLADQEAQVRGAAERTVRTLENDARIAGSRVETLQAAVDSQKTIVAQANENEVQLRALEREARAQREQLESYLGRFREATARNGANAAPADARIISRAIEPQAPSFPKKGPTVALATLAAFVLSSGALMARELLGGPRGDATGAEWREVEYPTINPRESGLSSPTPLSSADAAASERYDFEQLIARISKAEPQGRGRRLLVTGIGRSDEAGELALGLGCVLAQRGRAILISVDGPRDEASERRGFTDLVAGEVSFTDVIEREPGSRLHRVPVGRLDGALLVEEWQGAEIALSAFDQTYDWVICHARESGPALPLFAQKVDAVVIASEDEPASPRLVELYDAAKAAGASDVLVARERALAVESAEVG